MADLLNTTQLAIALEQNSFFFYSESSEIYTTESLDELSRWDPQSRTEIGKVRQRMTDG